MGYHHAGFDVVGVDIVDQPNYPFEFIQADALEYLKKHARRAWWVAAHGSPPCQRWSDLAKRNGNADEWPDLITPTRALFRRIGLPYVIENVESAPLLNPMILCGTQFPGLRVIRHRKFETSFPIIAPSWCDNRHPLVFTHDKRKNHYGKLDQDVSFVQVTGGGNATVANKRAAMGIGWMTGNELNEAIPPLFTEYIGAQLLKHLGMAGVVARKILEDLTQAREESIWLQAIVEYQNELITLGGIPQPCAQPAAAADVTAFRARRVGGSS